MFSSGLQRATSKKGKKGKLKQRQKRTEKKQQRNKQIGFTLSSSAPQKLIFLFCNIYAGGCRKFGKKYARYLNGA